MSAKLELTIRGLLKNIEDAVEEDSTDWRIKKYVRTLDGLLADLEHFDPEETNIDTYKKRAAAVKKEINYKEQVEKKPSGTVGDVMTEINSIKNAKIHQELRKELLGSENNGLRHRNVVGGDDNLEQAVKHYSNIQEKLAEEMLLLTQNLKEQTQTANMIIKKDTEIVSRSSQMTEKNYDVLASESNKLQDHSKRAWKCWMLFFILLVIVIFITMVLFMRVTKKRTS
ncbi:vesicle transport protein USE1 [Culicoides brevitarsis]|uniref:vesicle transport protein USE1 n=1 Tax=Culicoides brevitarsis TaxID=469753 RepID=UPI00307CC762